jgi:hypothetical protein
MARYGAQERPAVSWLILNRSGNIRLPANAVAGPGLAAAHRLRSFSGRARLPADVGHFRHGLGGPSEALAVLIWPASPTT